MPELDINGLPAESLTIPELMTMTAKIMKEKDMNARRLSWALEIGQTALIFKKPHKYKTVFAEICIRIFEYCNTHDIDLEECIMDVLLAHRDERQGG
jgi:hypothetical protein